MFDLSSRGVRMAWYAAIFVVGFMLISLWSFWLVTHPERIYGQVRPEQLGLPYEDIKLTAEDGIEIAGWFFSERDKNRHALILLHGYPADKGDMLFFAREFYSDFDILLIDFRYFGESGGNHTTLGYKERLDLKAAVDFLEIRGYGKVGVMGFSLGGAVALMRAAEDEEVGAVVSYASFAELRTLGRDAYWRLSALKYALVWLMEKWASIFYGINISEILPAESAKKLEVPVLVVHSVADEQIPVKHGYLLRESLKGNPQAEFYFPEKGRHGELPPDFETRVVDFFQRALE